jgi:hypothetical protein
MNSLGRRISGSLLAATAGWSVIVVWAAYVALHPAYGPRDRWILPLLMLIISAIFVFGIWLILLLPLYLLVPRRSILWWWPICTICGAACGAALMFVVGRTESPQATDAWLYEIFGAAVGGVTCLVGSLTARYFDAPPPPNPYVGCQVRRASVVGGLVRS